MQINPTSTLRISRGQTWYILTLSQPNKRMREQVRTQLHVVRSCGLNDNRSPPRGKSEAPGHAALGAGDRPWRGGKLRPQPATQGGSFFLSFAAGWRSHPGVTWLVNRYQQGRTNAATLAN